MSKRQEAFDKIVAAMAAQGWERSMSALGTSCGYRGVGGRVCAIGALLDDDEALVCDELSCGVLNLPAAIEYRLVADTGFSVRELCWLQKAHDRGDAVMMEKFKALADSLHLEMKL